MGNQQLDTVVRVTVRDTASKHGMGWNDEYTLYDRPNQAATVFRSFEKPNTGPNTTMFRNENVPIGNVPGRVADVFDIYVDGNALGLPVTGNPVQDLQREDATITVDKNGTTYSFDVFNRSYVELSIDGTRDSISNVPATVESAVDPHLPNNVQYL
ncbi:hypothetical protein [Natrinema pallidum]|uniref:Uncharacterized protein n=1 Tax=Natrinema pallidum TaxID=69527 RepID=A0A4P9TB98_9EURY|nr:hypothetical protein [Natrinema pallidum]QCW01893.1 hypothetical protein FGF80_00950 [Natrinema pallidum]